MSEKIEFTVFLFNKKMEDDLNITLPEIEAKYLILVDDVSSIREIAEQDGDEIRTDRCNIMTKYGESYHVAGSFDETQKKLTAHGW